MSLAAFSQLHGNYGTNFVPGVDVSGWQTPQQLEQALSWARFAWVKASQGVHFYEHETTAAQVAVCRHYNVPYGLYHFANARNDIFQNNDPRAEAQLFASAIAQQGGPGALPPVLDYEIKSAPGDQSAWTLSFLTELERLIGRRPMFYSGSGWIDEHLTHPDLGSYKLWVAHYAAPGQNLWCPVGPWSDWMVWQYQQVTPEHGDLDVNVAKPDFLQLLGDSDEEDDLTLEQAQQLDRIEILLKRRTMRQFRSRQTGTVWLVWGVWKSQMQNEALRSWMMGVGLLAEPDEFFDINDWDLGEFTEIVAEDPPSSRQQVIGAVSLLEAVKQSSTTPPPINLAGNFEAIADRMATKLISALKEADA